VIQTITTVGYGDVVPYTEIGRLVGVIAMLSAIGISSLVTAAATSSLMEKFRKERDKLKEQSVNYVEKLERKVENLNSEMAKKEHMEELKKI
jgi:voltage-gated potassium channel